MAYSQSLVYNYIYIYTIIVFYLFKKKHKPF